MNDNELIESLISADLGNTQPITAIEPDKNKEKDSRAATLKLSDYSSYNQYQSPESILESQSCIPNYRLANCCCNCAFSTYNPVTQEAHCSKWDCCVISVYYCDSHTPPSSLLPTDSSERLSEPPQLPEPPQPPESSQPSLDLELYSEAVESCPQFELKEATAIYINQKYKQLYKLKHGSLEGCNID